MCADNARHLRGFQAAGPIGELHAQPKGNGAFREEDPVPVPPGGPEERREALSAPAA